jgi:hypothetical protein
MPDLDQIKQGKQGARDGRGRFAKGRPAILPAAPAAPSNRATRAAERLLDGEAAARTRKAVELALAGDQAALRLCLDRTVAPRRERAVELALPPIHGADDILAAIKVVRGAVGRGAITPGEGFTLSQMIETFLVAAIGGRPGGAPRRYGGAAVQLGRAV